MSLSRHVLSLIFCLILSPLARAEELKPGAPLEEGFTALFDGKSLDGWTEQDASLKSYKIDDGAILCNGAFTHLFYSGKVNDAKFTNFELRADFKMEKGSNSGIFFHTENPGAKKKVEKGYECQICDEAHKDPKKTGSLYDIQDVKESPAKADEWATYIIRVEGKHITLIVNGKTTIDYTEPTPVVRNDNRKGRVISSGTFALQAHDPKSKVWIKNIRVKALP